jgi:hypothetical protein
MLEVIPIGKGAKQKNQNALSFFHLFHIYCFIVNGVACVYDQSTIIY